MYNNVPDVGSALVGAGIFIFVVVLAMIMIRNRQGSHFYRKYLANLYVAARIRELAKKDNLDLISEEKNFLKYDSSNKKSRLRDLDEKIEAELMDRVEESNKKPKEEKA